MGTGRTLDLRVPSAGAEGHTVTGPRLHEREHPVAVAKRQIEMKFWEAVEEADPELTYVELLQVLTSLQQGCLKYMLRYERHGEYDTPSGWEK